MRRVQPHILKCLVTFVFAHLLLSGCANQSQWVSVRETPKNRLADSLNLFAKNGIRPSERTQQVLRRYDLEKTWNSRPGEAVLRLDTMATQEDSPELAYAVAELAYIQGKNVEGRDKQLALTHYGTSLLHAYHFLFDQRHAGDRNQYDPQFRGACDLYNQALEETLRIVQRQDAIRPGSQTTVETASQTCGFDVVMYSSGWHEEDVERFAFVSDYELKGLTNHYHNYGLGVPLIGIRKEHQDQETAEQYYPPGLAFPMTAFLRIEHQESADGQGEPKKHFVLELHDPLDRDSLQVAGMTVPLEADLSTPLAYYLNQPQFNQEDISNIGLLFPDKVQKLQGLYMLEPYDSAKMPVVMVHGLWSSPATWMEMFNDLRSDPSIRDHYQFWFYLYPTGQPFWISAAQMRGELASARQVLDPDLAAPALDQTVLVGHSMGGLVSRLQSVDAENHFWSTISDYPVERFEGDEEFKAGLAKVFFFQPSPSVRRVVTIGTPHRGSEFANDTTRWLSSKLIELPMRFADSRAQLISQNRELLREDAPLDIRTSIDSLAPNQVLLDRLLTADAAPWVDYHNIVGRQKKEGFAAYFAGEGDGVVSLASARLDELPQLDSQIIVPADHMSVHRHPQAVIELRRILLQQLADIRAGDLEFEANEIVANEAITSHTR